MDKIDQFANHILTAGQPHPSHTTLFADAVSSPEFRGLFVRAHPKSQEVFLQKVILVAQLTEKQEAKTRLEVFVETEIARKRRTGELMSVFVCWKVEEIRRLGTTDPGRVAACFQSLGLVDRMPFDSLDQFPMLLSVVVRALHFDFGQDKAVIRAALTVGRITNRVLFTKFGKILEQEVSQSVLRSTLGQSHQRSAEFEFVAHYGDLLRNLIGKVPVSHRGLIWFSAGFYFELAWASLVHLAAWQVFSEVALSLCLENVLVVAEGQARETMFRIFRATRGLRGHSALRRFLHSQLQELTRKIQAKEILSSEFLNKGLILLRLVDEFGAGGQAVGAFGEAFLTSLKLDFGEKKRPFVQETLFRSRSRDPKNDRKAWRALVRTVQKEILSHASIFDFEADRVGVGLELLNLIWRTRPENPIEDFLESCREVECLSQAGGLEDSPWKEKILSEAPDRKSLLRKALSALGLFAIFVLSFSKTTKKQKSFQKIASFLLEFDFRNFLDRIAFDESPVTRSSLAQSWESLRSLVLVFGSDSSGLWLSRLRLKAGTLVVRSLTLESPKTPYEALVLLKISNKKSFWSDKRGMWSQISRTLASKILLESTLMTRGAPLRAMELFQVYLKASNDHWDLPVFAAEATEVFRVLAGLNKAVDLAQPDHFKRFFLVFEDICSYCTDNFSLYQDFMAQSSKTKDAGLHPTNIFRRVLLHLHSVARPGNLAQSMAFVMAMHSAYPLLSDFKLVREKGDLYLSENDDGNVSIPNAFGSFLFEVRDFFRDAFGLFAVHGLREAFPCPQFFDSHPKSVKYAHARAGLVKRIQEKLAGARQTDEVLGKLLDKLHLESSRLALKMASDFKSFLPLFARISELCVQVATHHPSVFQSCFDELRLNQPEVPPSLPPDAPESEKELLQTLQRQADLQNQRLTLPELLEAINLGQSAFEGPVAQAAFQNTTKLSEVLAKP